MLVTGQYLYHSFKEIVNTLFLLILKHGWCYIIFSWFQRIRSTVDEKEQKQLLMDLDVVMRSSDCKYIVKFYGALFTEVMTPKNIVLICF